MPSIEGIWNFEQSGTALVAATLAGGAQVRGKLGLGRRLLSAGGNRPGQTALQSHPNMTIVSACN